MNEEDGQLLYPREVLLTEIVKLLSKHGARVLNPATDIIFSESNSQVVLILDGVDHMAVAKDEEKLHKGESPPVVNENEDDSDSDEEAKAPVKIEAKPVEEEMPTVYNC